MKPQTVEWIEKAEGDWKVARREFDCDAPVFDAVCFHAQQAAEKYLKALLEEQSITVPKTHDLIILLNFQKEFSSVEEEWRHSLAALSAYSVAFRYPGEEALIEDAKESLDTALCVRAWVREKLGLTDNP